MPRYRDNNSIFDLRINNIEYMQTVRDNRIQKLTITVSADSIDETIVTDLKTLLEDSAGPTQLYIQLVAADRKTAVLLRSRGETITVKHNLIRYIESNPNMTYHVN